MEALIRVATALQELRVPYATIGAVAVGLAARPRSTNDVDAAVSISNIQEFLSDLEKSAIVPRIPDAVNFARKFRVLLLQDKDGTEIDFSLAALPFEENMIDQARTVEIAPGVTLRFARAEDLLVMKAIITAIG